MLEIGVFQWARGSENSLKKKLGTLQLRTVKMKHEPLLTSFWEFIGRI